MKLLLTLTDTEFNQLWRDAVVVGGYLRDDPSKAWSQREKQRAVRWYIYKQTLRTKKEC